MDLEDRTFGLCKCCLQDGSFRSLWVAYDEKGMLQNYGEMLNQCFSLHWQKPDNIHLEQICDECIKRTKDAFGFWRQVLQSQIQLGSQVEEPSGLTEVLDEESGQITLIKKEESIPELTLDEVTEEYEAVEYLDMYCEEELVDDPQYYPEVSVINKELRSKKCPQKRRRRTYKNYSNDDFKECLEAVKSGRMSVADASGHYNVPRKTVAAKILSEKRGEITGLKADKNHEMIKEIKTLLTYTNMTPYKTRTAHYHCAYCSTDGPVFEDPDELRTHTRTLHAEERTKSVEQFLRPVWLNEVLKVDIENLHCTVCCVILVSWNDMFRHLNEQHNLDFDIAYTRVIPYLLKTELRCALCKALFPNYHQLDGHMNAHYNSYMCSECGDTFLAASRLKKHLKIHDTGRFPCEECGKVYSLEKYRKKHIELVHEQQQNVRCLYCDEKFLGTYNRHQHVIACHPEKTKSITCEMCGKSFDWRPYFLAHIRRKHNNEKNHTCSICSAKFFMKSELRRHVESHKYNKKISISTQQITKNTQSNVGPSMSVEEEGSSGFGCVVCGNWFHTQSDLLAHQSTHEIVFEFNDIEASV